MTEDDYHERITTPDRSSSGEKLSERITLRTSETLVERAENYAEEHDLDRSEALREALREYFDV
jgi:hypothetical protein